MSVKKDSRGLWRAFPFYKKRLETRSFKTKGEALAYEAQTVKQAKLEHDKGTGNLTRFTFKDLCDFFLAHQRHRVDLEVYYQYENKMAFYRDSPISDKPVNRITPDDIDSLIVYWKSLPTAQSKKRKSFRREYQILRSMFYIYRDYKRDTAFNLPLLKPHRIECERLLDGSEREKVKKGLKPEWVTAWFDELQKMDNLIFHDLAYVMLFCGLRRGEALGLTAKAVNLAENEISITQQLKYPDHGSRKPYIKSKLKTESSRRKVKMSDRVRSIILKYVKAHPFATEDNPYGLLFWYPRQVNQSGKLSKEIQYAVPKQSIRNHFNKALEKANIPRSGTHICRHTFVSLGGSIHGLDAMRNAVGHTDLKTTQGYCDDTVIELLPIGQSIEEMLSKASQSRL